MDDVCIQYSGNDYTPYSGNHAWDTIQHPDRLKALVSRSYSTALIAQVKNSKLHPNATSLSIHPCNRTYFVQ
jgi:hypothetical protein